MFAPTKWNLLLLFNTVIVFVLIFIVFKLQDIENYLQLVNEQLKRLEPYSDTEHENRVKLDFSDVNIDKINGMHDQLRVNNKQDHIGKSNIMEPEPKAENTDNEIAEEQKTEGKLKSFLGGNPAVPSELPPLSKDEKTYLPKLDGINMVVMSLWGKSYKYTTGAVRNAELIKDFFPGWKLRVYVELPSDAPVHELVPHDVLDKLTALGAELSFIDSSENKIAPMMWRFLVADDMSVDRFIVRDSDSRLSARDAAAVFQWVKSGKALHCVRDHPSHSASALSGGMWGGTPGLIRNLLRRPFKQLMYGYKTGYGEDMNFLNQVIWPRLKDNFYCSDSVSCDRYASSHPYPIPRYGYEHVGQVYDDHELSRPVDIQILRQSRENERCSPAKPQADTAKS